MIRNFRPFTTPKLDPLQFGNRKGVSTTHLLVKLLHLCHQAADDGDSVRIVFLDYSKAFDRVNHQILLNKLASMDIPPHFLKWFASFLHARSQQVRLGDQFSSNATGCHVRHGRIFIAHKRPTTKPALVQICGRQHYLRYY